MFRNNHESRQDFQFRSSNVKFGKLLVDFCTDFIFLPSKVLKLAGCVLEYLGSDTPHSGGQMESLLTIQTSPPCKQLVDYLKFN